jgi:hypothetical protein
LGQLVVDLPGKFVQDYVQKKMDEGGDWRGLTKTDEFVEGEEATRALARGKTQSDIDLIRKAQIPQSQGLTELYGAQTGETQARTKEIPASEEAQRYQAIAGGTSSLMHARTGRMAEDRMLRGQGISTSLELAKMAQDQQKLEWQMSQAVKARAVGPRASDYAKKFESLDKSEQDLLQRMNDLYAQATSEAVAKVKAQGVLESDPRFAELVKTETVALSTPKTQAVVARYNEVRGRKQAILQADPSLDVSFPVLQPDGSYKEMRLSEVGRANDRVFQEQYGLIGRPAKGVESNKEKTAPTILDRMLERPRAGVSTAFTYAQGMANAQRAQSRDALTAEIQRQQLELAKERDAVKKAALEAEIRLKEAKIKQLERDIDTNKPMYFGR